MITINAHSLLTSRSMGWVKRHISQAATSPRFTVDASETEVNERYPVRPTRVVAPANIWSRSNRSISSFSWDYVNTNSYRAIKSGPTATSLFCIKWLINGSHCIETIFSHHFVISGFNRMIGRRWRHKDPCTRTQTSAL